jgi:cytoskeletal protein CcmA (bactofilin family)
MGLFPRQHIRLPMMNWAQVTPRPEARQAPTTRDLDCPFCGQALRVPVRAINTRCTECHKHLRLEDVVVRGDSPLTRISTCGTILIEPNARFSGVLQAVSVVVAGRVMGTIIGTRSVEVTATGKVAGTIATRDLKTDQSALIDGEVNLLNADGSVTRLATGEDHQPASPAADRPSE